MSIFADLDLESVPDDFAAGKYHGHIYDAKIVTSKDPTKGQFVVLTYKASDNDVNGNFKGATKDEFKSANKTDSLQQKKFLKSRMTDLGVPESRLNSLNLNDLKGLEVIFEIIHKGGWVNVSKVELVTSGTPVSQTATSNGDPWATLLASATNTDLGAL